MKRINLKKLISCIIALGLMITTCFLSGDDVEAATASLNKTAVSIKVGEKTTLKVTASNMKKVKWSSADSSIAKVTSKGKVTGKQVGNTKITAKVYFKNGKTKTCKCKVYVKSGRYVKAVPYQTGGSMDVYNNDGNSFLMMGETYYYGVVGTPCYTAWAQYNLNGDYQTFTFLIGHIDNTEGNEGEVVIELDGEIVATYSVTGDMTTQTQSIDVTDAVNMKVWIRNGRYVGTKYAIANPVLDKGHD